MQIVKSNGNELLSNTDIITLKKHCRENPSSYDANCIDLVYGNNTICMY